MENVVAAHLVLRMDGAGQIAGYEIVMGQGFEGDAGTAVDVLNHMRVALDDAGVIGNCLLRVVQGQQAVEGGGDEQGGNVAEEPDDGQEG